jgi:hypothetical protein
MFYPLLIRDISNFKVMIHMNRIISYVSPIKTVMESTGIFKSRTDFTLQC